MKLKFDFLDRVQAARQYLADGDPQQAIAQLDLVLAKNANDSSAIQLRQAALKELSQRRLSRSALAADSAANEKDPTARLALLREAAELSPEDSTLQIKLGVEETQNQIYGFMSWRSHFLERVGRASEAEIQRQTLKLLAPDYVTPLKINELPPVLVESTRETKPTSQQKIPAAAPPRTLEPPKSTALPRTSPAPHKGGRRNLYLGAGGALAILGLVAFAVLQSRQTQPSPGSTRLTITVEPGDALVEINGSRYEDQPLPGGTHALKISRLGYALFERQIALPVTEPMRVTLRPLGTTLRIDAQPSPAEWALDDGQPATFPESQASFPALPPGKHILRIYAEAGTKVPSSFEFETEAAQPPRVTAINTATDSIGLAVSQFSSEKPVLTSSETLSVLDSNGSEAGQTGTSPVTLPFANAGDWIIRNARSSENTEWRIQTAASVAPILDLYLRTNAPTGGVLLRVDEDARLRINGKLQSRPILRRGTVTPLRGLAPGNYRISAEKDGYRVEPAVAQIRIAARKDVPLEFHLIHLASVQIRNARAGSRLFVNGNELGTAGENGSLSVQVDPGPCRLELRLAKYQHRPVERQCGPGETIMLSGQEVAMTMTVGQIHFPSVTPPETKIVVSRAGESITLSAGYNELPVGRYQLRASAPGYADKLIPNLEIVPARTNEAGPIDLKPGK